MLYNVSITFVADCASNCITCAATDPGKCDTCKTGYRLKTDKTCEGNLIE